VSYIIAFVKFDDSDMNYPVECFRTDIKPQGRVLVRLANERIKQATVERVDYLNWDCTGRIAWKAEKPGSTKKVGSLRSLTRPKPSGW
jgi:hypothetical protein